MSRRTEDNFAKARSSDLIAEQVGDELVVYDSRSSEAHCLSPLAAAVFSAADGSRSPEAIAAFVSAKLGDRFEVQHVEMALAELEDRGLVTVPAVSGISRRSFMQRTAAVGGAAFAGTLITSVVAPAYGMAASLPQGFPSGFSSLAIQICGPNQSLYGAGWGPNTPNDSTPTDGFGITHANAFCPPSGSWQLTSNSWPTGVNEPVLNYVSGGVCISLPSGYSICHWAAFFGKGALGQCGTQQCFYGTTLPTAACGYLVQFPASCYS